ncbi:unnamed protein product [Caenorhabditis sp. 36 PRJEB53466]|nr:unnamed protein product [Caenorhabditis sp. 36 PRJEB53466]
MSAADLLAEIAGLTSEAEHIVVRDSTFDDCEEVNYNDVEVYSDQVSEQQIEEPIPERYDVGAKKRSKACRGIGARELNELNFRNPGSAMSQMLPDGPDWINSNRGKRIATAAAQAQQEKEEGLRHDKTGKLSGIVNGEKVSYDLCDCLDETCSGCHWPCKNCKSRKCLLRCRQNRKYRILRVEEMYTVEGTDGHAVTTNPYLALESKP